MRLSLTPTLVLPLYCTLRPKNSQPAVNMRYNDRTSNDADYKGSAKVIHKPTTKVSPEPGPGSSATAQSSHPASGVWQPIGTNALKSSLAAARNPSQAPRGAPTGPRLTRPKSTMMMNVQTPSDVAADLGNLNISGPQTQGWNSNTPKYYDPSQGPSRSTMTTPWRGNSQVSSTCSVRQPYYSEYCRTSNFHASRLPPRRCHLSTFPHLQHQPKRGPARRLLDSHGDRSSLLQAPYDRGSLHPHPRPVLSAAIQLPQPRTEGETRSSQEIIRVHGKRRRQRLCQPRHPPACDHPRTLSGSTKHYCASGRRIASRV